MDIFQVTSFVHKTYLVLRILKRIRNITKPACFKCSNFFIFVSFSKKIYVIFKSVCVLECHHILGRLRRLFVPGVGVVGGCEPQKWELGTELCKSSKPS